MGSFGFSRIFFLQVPPSDFVPVGESEPPHQKFRGKNPENPGWFVNKEDGLVPRLHCLRLCVGPCMARQTQSLKSTCLTTKFWSFLDHTCGNGQKKTKLWFLWFLQSMFLLSYPYQWCGFGWQSWNLWPQFINTLQFSVACRSTGDQCSHNKLTTLVPSILVSRVHVNVLHRSIHVTSHESRLQWMTDCSYFSVYSTLDSVLSNFSKLQTF